MDYKQKEILQKFSAQKVELARSQKIISNANKLMNEAERLQDRADSQFNQVRKIIDNLVQDKKQLSKNNNELLKMINIVNKEKQDIEKILKELGATTSASKEYGLLENAARGLKDLQGLGKATEIDIENILNI
jgi:ABC-type transporter Mla subunit MlaD